MMVLAGNVAHMREMRNAKQFWSANLKRTYHLEDQGVDGWIILK
jgi:hypothetical protein